MKFLIILFITILLSFQLLAQKRHPNYSGGHHTNSHGGIYRGSINSHHKGGHYVNSKTSNTYGRHKKR